MVIYLDYNIKRLQLIKELLVVVIRAQPVILTIALSITESNRVSQKTLRTHALSIVTERAGDAVLWTIWTRQSSDKSSVLRLLSSDMTFDSIVIIIIIIIIIINVEWGWTPTFLTTIFQSMLRWPSFFGCRCSRLEQSAWSCHFNTVAVFWSRLKTHLFNISYPSPLWLYSARAVTLVALDTINVFAYLLTFIVPFRDNLNMCMYCNNTD